MTGSANADELYAAGRALLPAWNDPSPDPARRAEAVAKIRRAAELGHAGAMKHLPQLISDPAEQLRWLRALADLGSGSSLSVLVADPRLRDDVAADVATAVERGEGWAVTAVAAVYYGGLAPRDGTKAVPVVADPEAVGHAMLVRAAEGGYAPAQVLLAQRLGKTDPTRALALARAAYESGTITEPDNARHLADLVARLLEDVGGVSADVLAVRTALATSGDPRSMVWLGERHRAGELVPRDPARAKELFERAIALGSGAGHRELAKMLEAGDGVPVDDERAREHYESAAELEADPYACERLVTKYGLTWYAEGVRRKAKAGAKKPRAKKAPSAKKKPRR